MKITNKEIKKALDKAYKKAGDNAYFGNGFKSGVEFAQDKFNIKVQSLLRKFCEYYEANVDYMATEPDTIILDFINENIDL